jgi:TRAP-type C4-dicarboxylate transport system substrate-binding protein
MTNHVWACIHYSFGNPYWDKLPNDLMDLSTKHFNAAAMAERDDWQKMTADETKNLTAKGLVFNTPDIKPFQEVLKKAGFYGDMKKKSGDKAWALLEKYVGPLA